jgi:murein DD-endopeptidase MepM/ murein hydrolase activator NlpD
MRWIAGVAALMFATSVPVLMSLGCGNGGRSPTEPEEVLGLERECGIYPYPDSSPYVLPFPIGTSAPVFQSNCGPPNWTHIGALRYATDFTMFSGSLVTAARGGKVIYIRESARDGIDTSIRAGNHIGILHNDGTVGVYNHFTHEGIFPRVGDRVETGQDIGLTGDTGFTGHTLHLHFEVQGCREGCATIPMTFRNADPPDPGGLEPGVSYTALAW